MLLACSPSSVQQPRQRRARAPLQAAPAAAAAQVSGIRRGLHDSAIALHAVAISLSAKLAAQLAAVERRLGSMQVRRAGSAGLAVRGSRKLHHRADGVSCALQLLLGSRRYQLVPHAGC